MKKILVALTAASILASPALAAPGDSPATTTAEQAVQNASIPFANFGGISTWQADGDSAVLFEDAHNQWYKADLFAPAIDLPYAETIGIDAGPTGTLDQFGAIYVDGERYPFSDFVKIADPNTPA